MIKSVLQTEAWSRFKEQSGWHAHNTGGLYGLERVLGFGRSMLYFPELPFGDEALAVIKAVRHEKVPAKRIFTRFEFLEPWSAEGAKQLIEAGLIKAFEDVQPNYRQWITLEKTEEELLKDMKPKGRYNIRVAQKHGLKVSWGLEAEKVDALARLYQETAKRTGFAGRNAAYFQRLTDVIRANSLGEIVTVTHGEEVLAAALVTFYGGVASYLYGGSGGDRTLMAPYLMHWVAIQRAKKAGCLVYDLLAIAPDGRVNHPHAGLTRFKTQFGGQSVRMLGSWDLVHNRFWYTMYRYAQKRRRRAL